MRIGIDIAPLLHQSTGIGQYTLQILKRLVELDKENEYCLYTFKEVDLPFSLPKNFHIVVYSKIRKHIDFMLRLPFYIKKDSIDLFWGPRGYLPFGNTKVKYVITIHDLTPILFPKLFTFKQRSLFSIMVRIACRKSSTIITESNSTQNDIIKLLKVRNKPIETIYLGSREDLNDNKDLQKINKIKQKLGIRKDYILSLSTVEPRKNMLRIIKAFEKCMDKFDVQLVIVGASGWKNSNIYNYVKENNLESRIIFPGRLSDDEIKHIYNGACLFVYPSLYEGFGLPILEAMKSGVPVITSNISSMPEVAGNAAILVDPYSESEIEKAMVSVLSSPELMSSLISKGSKQEKLFSWDKCAERTLKSLLEMNKR